MREVKYKAFVVKTRLDNMGSNMHLAGVSEYEVMIDVRGISLVDGKVDYVNDSEGDEYSYSDGSLKAIRQYTELTDKNGVAIFEGDIVRLRNGEVTEVFYQSGCYMISKLTTVSLHDNKKANINYLLCNEAIDLAVIGNIYENPSLITKYSTEKTPKNTAL